MPLYFNEDQAMLQDSVRPFMAEQAPVAHLRKYRDMDCKDGFSHDLWKQFAEMGFTGILASEADGGLGMGHVETGIVLEEIGRNLTPSPFLATSVAGVTALNEASTDLRGKYLPGIIAGDTVLGIAIDEGAKHRPERIAMQAERSGNGFKLSGKKQFVLQGASADALIVAARTGGSSGETKGLTLFAVDKDTAGLSMEAVRLVDSAMAAHVDFDGVEVTADAVVGEVDEGWSVLRKVLAATRIGSAAELIGVGSGAMGMTVDYLKQRKQFGRLIGEFQALQYRAAHLYTEIEITKAAVMKALQTLDADFDSAGAAVAVAKAKAGSTATLAVQEAVQMHGGVGMTDAFDIGFFMKRARVCQELFGDAAFHAEQLARLKGY
mgnify:CR=1 FL=1